jgi:hypothetical protein
VICSVKNHIYPYGDRVSVLLNKPVVTGRQYDHVCLVWRKCVRFRSAVGHARSQRLRGARRGCSAVWLLGLRVRIPPGAWVCVVRCRPLRRVDHSSRRVLPSVMCDREASIMRRPWHPKGCCVTAGESLLFWDITQYEMGCSETSVTQLPTYIAQHSRTAMGSTTPRQNSDIFRANAGLYRALTVWSDSTACDVFGRMGRERLADYVVVKAETSNKIRTVCVPNTIQDRSWCAKLFFVLVECSAYVSDVYALEWLAIACTEVRPCDPESGSTRTDHARCSRVKTDAVYVSGIPVSKWARCGYWSTFDQFLGSRSFV